MKVMIEIVTGFLASGKTNFINALLKETLVKDDKTMVIQLEDGETKVDKINYNLKIYKYDGEISGLNSFILNKVKEFNLNHIIIEFNGTDDILELQDVFSKKEFGRVCRLSTVYFIADTKKIKSYILNMSELIIPALESSNLIVLNNFCGENENDSKEVINLIKDINLSGHIFTCTTDNDINDKIRKSDLFNKKIFKRTFINIRDRYFRS